MKLRKYVDTIRNYGYSDIVQLVGLGWTTGESGFDFRHRRYVSLHRVQTAFGAHLVSCLVGNGVLSGGKVTGERN
jgi:hypothetical protein